MLHYLHLSNEIHLSQYLHNSLRFSFTFFYFPFPYDTTQPSFAHNTHFIGLPTGLRSQIRNSNKGNWYKEMYNTMHRNQGRSKKMHYILTCYTYAVFDFIKAFSCNYVFHTTVWTWEMVEKWKSINFSKINFHSIL